jgi:hypothetical protein
MYWEFHESGFSQAVRWGKWKYIYKQDNMGKEEEYLFNLEEDLGETQNLSPKEPGKLVQMRNQAKSMHQKSLIDDFKLKEEKGK